MPPRGGEIIRKPHPTSSNYVEIKETRKMWKEIDSQGHEIQGYNQQVEIKRRIPIPGNSTSTTEHRHHHHHHHRLPGPGRHITPPLPPPPPPIVEEAKYFFHSHSLTRHTIQEKDRVTCKVCKLQLAGEVYGCNKRECSFFIHKSCFRIPKKIHHPSHPAHSLTLVYHSSYQSGQFICNACRGVGEKFHYHSVDKFDLHVACAALPISVDYKNHKYPLNLHYSFPGCREASTVKCKVCTHPFVSKGWVYYNQDTKFIAHLKCALAGNRITASDIQRRLSDMRR